MLFWQPLIMENEFLRHKLSSKIELSDNTFIFKQDTQKKRHLYICLVLKKRATKLFQHLYN